MQDDLLARLIAPVTLAEFVDQYWARYPLYVPGVQGKFDELIDESGFRQALLAGRSRIAALHNSDASTPLNASYTETIAPEEVDAALSEGHTVCITDLSASSADLTRIVAAARRQLGTIGMARFNAFLSPPGSGAELHIDARVTFSLQISGRKRWQYGAAPAIDWPRSNAQLLPSGEPLWMYPWCGTAHWERLAPPSQDELLDVVLSPGDLLCLPPGTWHSACAVDQSFALNLSFSPPDVPNLIGQLLARRLMENPIWRGGLPPSPLDVATAPDSMATPARLVLATMLAQAADLLTSEAAALAAGRPTTAQVIWAELAGRARCDLSAVNAERLTSGRPSRQPGPVGLAG